MKCSRLSSCMLKSRTTKYSLQSTVAPPPAAATPGSTRRRGARPCPQLAGTMWGQSPSDPPQAVFQTWDPTATSIRANTATAALLGTSLPHEAHCSGWDHSHQQSVSRTPRSQHPSATRTLLLLHVGPWHCAAPTQLSRTSLLQHLPAWSRLPEHHWWCSMRSWTVAHGVGTLKLKKSRSNQKYLMCKRRLGGGGGNKSHNFYHGEKTVRSYYDRK